MSSTKAYTIGSNWQLIMSGEIGFGIQLQNKCEITIHCGDTNAQPDDNSAGIKVGNSSNSAEYISVSGFTKGKTSVWARSRSESPAEIVVLTI